MFIVTDKSGFKVKWDNGKFFSNDSEKLKKIREFGRKRADTYTGVSLNGTTLGASPKFDYEKNKYTAYALLNNSMDIVEKSGDIPTITELYGEPDKGTLY